MPIDPKHFNKFMVVVAVIAAILIVIATLNYTSGRESAFQQQMMEADSLGYVKFPYVGTNDSLQLNQFQGKYLLLDFWAPWSSPSVNSQEKIADMSDTVLNSLVVIAASVRTDSSKVMQYREKHSYPFEFVDGTAFYQRMNLPGVPSQILFDPGGEVIATFVGYSSPNHYDSLQTVMHNE